MPPIDKSKLFKKKKKKKKKEFPTTSHSSIDSDLHFLGFSPPFNHGTSRFREGTKNACFFIFLFKRFEHLREESRS
jgi:hypothetical protein